jgi:hypothetical protein
MLENGNIKTRCNVTSTNLSVKEVKNPKPTDSYDFPDLCFQMLYHHNNLIGIIEIIGNEDYITCHLVYLAPENLFPLNYFSSIKLFTDLSRKFERNIIKENLTLSSTSITPAKKKSYISSPLVPTSFTPNSPSPTPPPSPADELDELLKLREKINMLGDRNCTVYALMSQLYPETFCGYRLSSTTRSDEEATRRITNDKNVQAKIQEIRNIAIEKLSQKRPADYTDDVDGELFDELLHAEYLTVNHLAVLEQHYNRVIVVMNTDRT